MASGFRSSFSDENFVHFSQSRPLAGGPVEIGPKGSVVRRLVVAKFFRDSW